MPQDVRMGRGQPTVGWCRSALEAILLAMSTLAPWAFGAVDAWAERALYAGVALLAVLMVPACWATGRWPGLSNLPACALAALAILAAVQSTPLPARVLQALAPAMSAQRAELAPSRSSRVIGDGRPPVGKPPVTPGWDADAARDVAARLAASWVLFQATVSLGGGLASLRRLALATAANATLMALFAMIQAATWNGAIYGFRPSLQADGWLTGGPFVSHSHLSAYLNLGLGFALVGVFAGGSRRPVGRSPSRLPLLACYASGVLIAGIVASHSRGGFLAMTASTAVVAAWIARVGLGKARRSAPPLDKFRRRGVAAGAILLTVSALLFALGSDSPIERLGTILDPGSRGYGLRLEIWEAALRCWRTSPSWGVGLGSFPAAVAPFFRRDRGVFASHAENEYLEMLTEGGALGLALALLTMLGVARSAWRALGIAHDRRDRAILFGTIFGVLAVLFASIGDFPLHIPAIGVALAISCGHLCRLGAAGDDLAPVLASSRWLATLKGLATAALALALIVHGQRMAKVEAILSAAGLPPPGLFLPTADADDRPREELERRRAALEQALRLRPDWTEGHLRLGNTLLGLYSETAEDWVDEPAGPVPAKGMVPMTDPLWLHRVVHASQSNPTSNAGLLEHEPIRLYLVPAARSFLEARRCCPALALPHARLASLDYLTVEGESTSAHASRALRQGTSDYRVLDVAARAAAQAGDLDLAAAAWRQALRSKDDEWAAVADAADAELPPERVLAKVLPPGARSRLRFADYLYAAPGEGMARELFLRAALQSLPNDSALDPVERLWVEGQVRARLGERKRGIELMGEAIQARPRCAGWRLELIAWHVDGGNAQAAHRLALAGTHVDPGHAGLQKALRLSVESLARGGVAPTNSADALGREERTTDAR